MAQFKKAESFEDNIELLDESGKVVRTIHVSISLDDLLGRYRRNQSHEYRSCRRTGPDSRTQRSRKRSRRFWLNTCKFRP